MAKSTITKAEYYQLEGLLLVALNHNKALREIERSIASLLGEEPDKNMPEYYGHVSDATYDFTTTAYDLMKKLGIDVE